MGLYKELSMTCDECGNFFDDNTGKSICKTCEDWFVEGKDQEHHL